MAVKAKDQITLSAVVDVYAVYRYYKLQASTLAAPSKPTVRPPSGWSDTEPSYTAGETNSLYMCDLTVFSDGTWSYSDVSLSSSYEAAKYAYNRAVAAAKTATDYMDFGTDGLTIGDMTSGALAGNVRIASDGIELRDGTTVLARLKAGLLELAANSVNAIIKLCGGKGTIAYYAETDQLAVMAPGSIAMAACQTLPDGTVQPYDSGVACNKSGVLLKGAVEASGTMKINSKPVLDYITSRSVSGQLVTETYASGKKMIRTSSPISFANGLGRIAASNNVVSVYIASYGSMTVTGSGTTFKGVMPVVLRPQVDVVAAGTALGNTLAQLRADTAGDIVVHNWAGHSYWAASLSYVVNP